MHPRRAGARLALLAVLIFTSYGLAAAERTGTPRMAGRTSMDSYDYWFGGGLGAAAPGDTLVLGSWTFGSASCTAEGWTSVDLTAGDTDFGDYAGLFSGRDQYSSDQCSDNLGCLWSFINGSADNMACAGRASQMVVPYGDAQRGYISNEIQSPLINLAGTGSAFALRFTVYRGQPFHSLVFYTWRVRSWHAGTPGGWRNGEFFFYGATVEHADWLIQEEPIGALIEPGADQIQVALGVIDMAGIWSGLLGDGTCHRNAPMFDSVKVLRVAGGGPQWFVDAGDLFQDNFAGDGTVTGTVRMDMARDINPRDTPWIQPGDSLVVTVSEPTVGMAYHNAGVPSSGPAVYLHVRNRAGGKSGGALSDDARWPVVATTGGWTTLRFDSVRTASGVIPGRYCVDLNDDLYTPGDTVVFYLSARDAAGRTTYWSEFTGTTSSASDAPKYPMEATCLPVTDRNGMSILLVDDTDGSGSQAYFEGALEILGIAGRVDRYDVRASHELAGNGPGSRVRNVDAQLADYYDTILWASGARPAGTIGDGSGAPEKSDDAAMLVEFIEKKVWEGAVYLSGDQIAAELSRLTSPSAAALRGYIQYTLASDSHSLIGRISPKLRAAPGSDFIHNGVPDSYNLFGGCPALNSFCVLQPAGSSYSEMLYDGTSYAAEVGQWNSGKLVIISGSGFEYIRDDELDGVSDRARHIGDILKAGELTICGENTGGIYSENAGARIEWRAASCASAIRVVRIADWGGGVQVIHTAAVPPSTGVYHDAIPYGQTATYRLEASVTHGQTDVIGTEVITRRTAITEFTADQDALGIRVAWGIEDRTGLEALSVQRRLAGESAFAAVDDDSLLQPSTTHYLDTRFTPGLRYEYRLAMHYAGGVIAYGEPAAVEAPKALTLGQNSPNPFNPATRIPFMMPSTGQVNVTIFNVNGQRVRTVWNGVKSAGYVDVEWDGRTDAGAPASSGIYFCRLRAFGQTLTRKIVMVR